MSNRCVVIFSGGTDSTAVAALKAADHDEIHLLTFFDESNRGSVEPASVVERLRARFPQVRFVHRMMSTDDIVRSLSFERYFAKLRRHGIYMAMTCGFTSLSWHLAALKYAREHSIESVSDGLTPEMTHLPGHMPAFIAAVRERYRRFGIAYTNPVYDWEVVGEKTISDKFIINHHGFMFKDEELESIKRRTTGRFVFERGLFPSVDVKGSAFDASSQHDCYPFVLYNILYFWLLRRFMSAERIEAGVARHFGALMDNLLETA